MRKKYTTIKETIGKLMENSLEAGATEITSKVENENGKLTVFVKDNGHGMDRETMDKVKKMLETKKDKAEPSSLEKLKNHLEDFHLASREGAGTEITLLLKE